MVDTKTAQELALALPEATSSQHFDRPDIRVRKKIFATLWLEEKRMVLKLSPESQMQFMQMHPDAFAPVKGAWGDKGWTSVFLNHIAVDDLDEALFVAWKQVAPKRLIKAYLAERFPDSSAE